MSLTLTCNTRLASSLAGLSNGYAIYSHRLPEPDITIYNDHSGRVALSDGGQSLRGFKSVRLTWARLTQRQAAKVREVAEYATVYATINRAWNADGVGGDWIDVSGKGHIPQVAPMGGSSAQLYESITLVINNLTIENDPATF